MNPNGIFPNNDNEACTPCCNPPSACDILKKHRDMLMSAQSTVNCILSTVVGDGHKGTENCAEPCSMMEELSLQGDLLCDVITKLQQLRATICG